MSDVKDILSFTSSPPPLPKKPTSPKAKKLKGLSREISALVYVVFCERNQTRNKGHRAWWRKFARVVCMCVRMLSFVAVVRVPTRLSVGRS